MRGVRASKGFSLLELVLAIALGALVLGAGVRLLQAVRRFWFAEREALAAADATRTAAAILVMELRGASPRSGDLLKLSDTAVTLRALRGLLVTCEAAGVSPGELVVSRASAPRAPVAGRESLLVFVPGSSLPQDRWLHAALAATAAGSCADSSSAWRLTLSAPAPVMAGLDSAGPGTPVRSFETVNYRLYDDGTRTWWLGVRAWQGASWASTSPLAGPLRPRDGLSLRYLAASGSPAAQDTAVRAVEITVRSNPTQVSAQGRRAGPRSESLTTLVAPRNE